MSSELRIHDKIFVPFISHEKILERINMLAREVKNDVPAGQIPLFIVVLKGSYMFASDFSKAYDAPAIMDFMRVKSYEGISSSGKPEILLPVTEKIEGKYVYILEDIVDTGNTLHFIREILIKKNPASLKIVSLFFKPKAYKYDIPVDFTGFEIPNKFIVGYGLDYDELGRNLKDVYQLKND